MRALGVAGDNKLIASMNALSQVAASPAAANRRRSFLLGLLQRAIIERLPISPLNSFPCENREPAFALQDKPLNRKYRIGAQRDRPGLASKRLSLRA
jgi:hypothetical protein